MIEKYCAHHVYAYAATIDRKGKQFCVYLN